MVPPLPSESDEARTNFDNAFDLYHEGEFPKALEEIQVAIANDPKHADAHNLHGAILETLDRWVDARSAYEKAVQLDPDWEEYQSDLANLLANNFESHEQQRNSAPARELTSHYEFHVVPFVGHLNQGLFSVENASAVSDQLQELIDSYGEQGWDFYRIEKINIQVDPGCLAGLFGVRASVVEFDQVIFRKPLVA